MFGDNEESVMSARGFVLIIALAAFGAAGVTVWALNASTLASAIPVGLAAVLGLRAVTHTR